MTLNVEEARGKAFEFSRDIRSGKECSPQIVFSLIREYYNKGKIDQYNQDTQKLLQAGITNQLEQPTDD